MVRLKSIHKVPGQRVPFNGHAVTIMKKYCGFTLMELIFVILVTGVLSAIVIPKINFGSFRAKGFFQQSIASIRFAQKLAISTGCKVDVVINNLDADICEVKWNSCAGGANIQNPATGKNDFCDGSSPAGTIPNVSFTFNNIGAPIGGKQTFTIDSKTITVEANTGFVHE